MTEPYIVWALLVGVGVGGALVWFVLGRLPRRSEDVGPEERVLEASWVSDVLYGRGYHVPQPVVEQILELHLEYIAGPALEMSAQDRAALQAERERRAQAQAAKQAQAVEEAAAGAPGDEAAAGAPGEEEPPSETPR